jgi:hypothetical protein
MRATVNDQNHGGRSSQKVQPEEEDHQECIEHGDNEDKDHIAHEEETKDDNR